MPRPDLTGMTSGHVGRLLMATRYVMGGSAGEAEERDYAAALRASPGVVNFYKDMGDMYARTYRHPQGWVFYDLGRLLPGHTSGDMLGEIDRMEARLRADLPELF